MDLYSAVTLLCLLVDGEQALCQTLTPPTLFTSEIDCHRHLIDYEMETGPIWAKEEKYIVSSLCIDWKWQVNRRFLVDQELK